MEYLVNGSPGGNPNTLVPPSGSFDVDLTVGPPCGQPYTIQARQVTFKNGVQGAKYSNTLTVVPC